jgi:hypothetical protein
MGTKITFSLALLRASASPFLLARRITGKMPVSRSIYAHSTETAGKFKRSPPVPADEIP